MKKDAFQMVAMRKKRLSSLLFFALAITPMACLGQADTLFIQFHPKSKSTFPFETGGGYTDELIYRKFDWSDSEIVFGLKSMWFIHNRRTMKKKRVLKKDAAFIRNLANPAEVENYIISILKKYPFGGLPSQPGVKRLFIVEDDGGDFFTLYEVKWKLNL